MLQHYLIHKTCHPMLREGKVVIGPDGLLAGLLSFHVDDHVIHGSSLAKLEAALDHILNTTIRLGLICHPFKNLPPTQRVKYFGFEYDTTSTPSLHIPRNKIQSYCHHRIPHI